MQTFWMIFAESLRSERCENMQILSNLVDLVKSFRFPLSSYLYDNISFFSSRAFTRVFFPKIGFDTAENGPLKKFVKKLPKVRKTVRTNIGRLGSRFASPCFRAAFCKNFGKACLPASYSQRRKGDDGLQNGKKSFAFNFECFKVVEP